MLYVVKVSSKLGSSLSFFQIVWGINIKVDPVSRMVETEVLLISTEIIGPLQAKLLTIQVCATNV